MACERLRINRSSKNPTLRKAEKRYRTFGTMPLNVHTLRQQGVYKIAAVTTS